MYLELTQFNQFDDNNDEQNYKFKKCIQTIIIYQGIVLWPLLPF